MIYINIRLISKNKCSVKILFGDIKGEFVKFLPNLSRSKVDRFSHFYLHVFIFRTVNIVKMSYFLNIIHISIIISKLY